MADPFQLKARAAMFARRAEEARDPVSRAHYREMAAHYRTLAVEHEPVHEMESADH
jgi:hypothetical protein